MSAPVVEVGDKVHVITRRLFEADLRRHFVGEVTRVSGELQEVHGYAFVFQAGANEYRKSPELRTRIFSFGDAGLIVLKLPRTVDVAAIQYKTMDKRLVITDGDHFTLDINEFGR